MLVTEPLFVQIERYRTEFKSCGLESLLDDGKDLNEEMKTVSKLVRTPSSFSCHSALNCACVWLLKIEKTQNEKLLSQSATVIYKKFIATAEEKHICPVIDSVHRLDHSLYLHQLCARKFNSAEETANFVETNRNKVNRVIEGKETENVRNLIKEQKAQLETVGHLCILFA